MQLSTRFALPAVLTALITAAGCGGSETTHGTFVDPASVEAKGGTSKPGTTTSSATITAAPNPADRNAPLTFTLNPGSYAGQMLFIQWECYQDGAMLGYDGSDELNNGAATGTPGYGVSGSNLLWTMVVSQSPNDNLVAGAGASCTMEAWYQNKRLQWFKIASGTFTLSP